VIVEVKTRAADTPGPEAGLTHKKGLHLARLASRLQERREFRDHPIRLDAVAIVWPPDGDPEIRHYEDAFEN
ncbi:MAG: YraN family protein, partial [Planctomycetota bacterium]|jgi:Holliday junction resolvase-like predicted endonuclease